MIEIMVTLLIISILTAVAVPVYQDVSASAQRSACFANQRTIEGVVQVFVGAEGGVPDSLTEMVEQGYFSQIPQCPTGGDTYNVEADGSVTPCSSHGYYRD